MVVYFQPLHLLLLNIMSFLYDVYHKKKRKEKKNKTVLSNPSPPGTDDWCFICAASRCSHLRRTLQGGASVSSSEWEGRPCPSEVTAGTAVVWTFCCFNTLQEREFLSVHEHLQHLHAVLLCLLITQGALLYMFLHFFILNNRFSIFRKKNCDSE